MMSNKTITQLAEEISFRLLATKKHDDFDWLVETLSEYVEDSIHASYEQLKVIKEMEDLYGPNRALGV